ncbi:hypothetical protein ACFL6Y_03810 [Elusimicrobiota bacterium]
MMTTNKKLIFPISLLIPLSLSAFDLQNDIRMLQASMDGSARALIAPVVPIGIEKKSNKKFSGLENKRARPHALKESMDEMSGLTLLEKAEIFEKRTQEEHRPWFGLIVSKKYRDDGSLRVYSSLADSAIWTGNYIAAEAFRYAVTGEQDALRSMEESLWGFHALHQITGGQGLIARVIIPAQYLEDHPKLKKERNPWVPGTGEFAGWIWQGNLSHDQYNGYLFGVSNAWPYIKDTALRDAIREDVRQVGLHVIRNKMRIKTDDTHLDFRPNYAYQNQWPKALRKTAMPPWFSGNPRSGIHLMLVVSHVTQGPEFRQYYEEEMFIKRDMAFKMLDEPSVPNIASKYGKYADKVLKSYSDEDIKVTPEALYSSIGPDLAHRALYDICRLESDPDAQALYRKVFKIRHDEIANDKNTLWNFLYASQFPDEKQAIWDGIDSLHRFIVRPIFGSVENSSDPELEKHKGFKAEIFNTPPDEEDLKDTWFWVTPERLPFEKWAYHAPFAWQSNPFKMDGGSNLTQGSGAAYLVAYWLGRYHRFIDPTE